MDLCGGTKVPSTVKIAGCRTSPKPTAVQEGSKLLSELGVFFLPESQTALKQDD